MSGVKLDGKPINRFKVAELRDLLQVRGLDTSGLKVSVAADAWAWLGCG